MPSEHERRAGAQVAQLARFRDCASTAAESGACDPRILAQMLSRVGVELRSDWVPRVVTRSSAARLELGERVAAARDTRDEIIERALGPLPTLDRILVQLPEGHRLRREYGR